MSLTFNCPHCDAVIVVQFLKPGDECLCRSCGRRSPVPDDATATDRGSTLTKLRPRSAPAPEPVPAAYADLAGRGQRLGAAILDWLLIVAVYILFVIFIALSDNQAGAAVGLGLYIIGLLAVLVLQAYLLTVDGQTFGKKMVDIKIVKCDTNANGGFVTNVLLRAVLNTLIGFFPLYSLVDILFIFADDRRCIHDHIAGTKVVKCD